MTKPNPENCKNCSSKCAYDYAQFQYTIYNRTVLTISPLTSRKHHSSDVVYQGRRGASTEIYGENIHCTFANLAESQLEQTFQVLKHLSVNYMEKQRPIVLQQYALLFSVTSMHQQIWPVRLISKEVPNQVHCCIPDQCL